jgi:hypothetical protein
MELFLSWKQIRSEMEQELLWSHSAPKMLREIRTRKIDALMKLCPLEPQNFSALMHIIVDIPRWALYSPDILAKIFEAMAPLLELHLSTLTIGLMDIGTQLDVIKLATMLTPAQWLTLRMLIIRRSSTTSGLHTATSPSSRPVSVALLRRASLERNMTSTTTGAYAQSLSTFYQARPSTSAKWSSAAKSFTMRCVAPADCSRTGKIVITLSLFGVLQCMSIGSCVAMGGMLAG